MQRIATLARLELTHDEIALFADQLTAILAYADQVQQADTSALGADAASADPACDAERNDERVPSLPREAVLDQAPAADRRGGVFTVPRVLGS